MKFLAAALAVAIYASPVSAGIVCGSRDILLFNLDRKYGEIRRGSGWTSGKEIFEMWVSTRPPYTWTLLKTSPSGISCIMASGKYWTWDDVIEGEPT